MWSVRSAPVFGAVVYGLVRSVSALFFKSVAARLGVSDPPAHPLGRLLRLARGGGADAGGSRTEQVQRLEREAEAYDELLLRRLEARAPEEATAVPTDDEALIDTALYFAGQERLAQARRLRREDRLRVAALVGVGAVVVVLAVVLAVMVV